MATPRQMMTRGMKVYKASKIVEDSVELGLESIFLVLKLIRLTRRRSMCLCSEWLQMRRVGAKKNKAKQVKK